MAGPLHGDLFLRLTHPFLWLTAVEATVFLTKADGLASKKAKI